MSSEKRQRQRENRMRAVAAAERAKKRSSTTRKVLRVVLAAAAVLLALLLWSIFTGDDSSDSDADSGGDDRSDVGAASDPTACPAEDGSDGPLNQLPAPPPVCIDNEVLYAAAFDTNMGPFTMVLDPTLDPVSVNNFIVLARWGAYDGTLFHRVIADFMIQGGDVQMQYGTGGPGYSVHRRVPERGVVSGRLAGYGQPRQSGFQWSAVLHHHRPQRHRPASPVLPDGPGDRRSRRRHAR